MQWEYATADVDVADPPAFGVSTVEDGLPPQAAASSASAAVAMTAAAIRVAGGHARRGRCMTRVPLFILASSGAG